MVDLCADGAGFRYVPFEVWGRQRVLYGEGKVGTVGKVIWTTLIDAFPDLANAVTSLRADEDGNVAAEVSHRRHAGQGLRHHRLHRRPLRATAPVLVPRDR